MSQSGNAQNGKTRNKREGGTRGYDKLRRRSYCIVYSNIWGGGFRCLWGGSLLTGPVKTGLLTISCTCVRDSPTADSPLGVLALGSAASQASGSMTGYSGFRFGILGGFKGPWAMCRKLDTVYGNLEHRMHKQSKHKLALTTAFSTRLTCSGLASEASATLSFRRCIKRLILFTI